MAAARSFDTLADLITVIDGLAVRTDPQQRPYLCPGPNLAYRLAQEENAASGDAPQPVAASGKGDRVTVAQETNAGASPPRNDASGGLRKKVCPSVEIGGTPGTEME